ncbi:polyadenylate-binding protein-interacting protein 1-like [Patiria miniata]|uniref:Polyadenylate-binding protein-interacting protein 1 n=1 Tax=Patiria miniata TaxID=46514 RepID=A0A913Z980_PATMI|nr:polyadenylate-binding protein-interacting protein 1-like [Patiria miniata]XP_038048332.1 polyadenylate-binding protein-interacting protein 1-like [Patiria miniata]XP_038048333.1 polyadenylate-binding protein-interacting protein 1-like [Patiria miniata]
MKSLSANAAVFVPGKSWGPALPVYAGSTSVPPQQQWSGSGPAEFVPGMPWPGASAAPVPQQQQWSNGNEQSPYVNSNWEPDYVIMVKDILFSLSISPGSFEDHMRSLVENLNATIRTDKDLGTIADIIFEQAVLEPNFRYTGARACDYLTSHLVLPPNVSKFRKHINQRVKDAVESREVMAKDPNKMERLHGATMFLAELFLTSQVQVGNGPQRIKIYRTALNELMDTLVNNASSGNLKCLSLLLKLSGKEIEDYDREQNDGKASDQLNQIFLKARKHVTNEAIDKNVREVWLQLIELRAKRWGQGDAASYSGGAAAPPPASSGDGFMSASGDAPMFSSQPVFYNSKGQVISAAEAGFGDEYEGDFENYADYQNYEEYSSADPYTDYTSSSADPYAEYDLDPSHYQQDAAAEPDYADGFDELDAEIQAAFSDFLIETGQGDHS